MDLRELLSVAWRRRFLVIVVVVVAGGLGALLAISRESQYESTATIAITPDVERQGFVPSDNLSALLGTYAQTVESEAVQAQAVAILGRPLIGTVNGTTEEGTGILRVTVRADSPVTAQEDAEAVSEAFVRSIADDRFLVTQIVDPATTPTVPVQPRPPLIIATSLVVGFGAALLLAIAVEHYRRRLETPADLAEITQRPLIGQIPVDRLLTRGGPTILWDEAGSAAIQESFRSLRTNLGFVVGETDAVVQVTSASASQGKSTIVANLGVAFAKVGIKTAIVDADLRRPAQAGIFGVENTVGAFQDQLTGSKARRSVPTGYENLVLYPAGPPVPDPTGMLHSRFARLIQALRGTFQLVIVDSAPLLPVSDARIVAPWVDGLVVVLSAGRERPASVQRAIAEVELAGGEIKGFVINRAPASGDSSEYYYQRPGASLPDPELKPGMRDPRPSSELGASPRT